MLGVTSRRQCGPVFHLPLNLCFKFDLLQGRKSSLTHVCVSKQGRSQDFSKGGAEVMEAKALKKKNCL